MLLGLSRLLRALPRPLAMGLGRCVGLLWYYFIPVRRRVAHRNVERVYGDTLKAAEKRRIVRRTMQNLCLYAVEGLRMPDMTAERSAALVARVNIDRVDALLARGRGVVAVTAHVGNFDLLGTSQTVRGYPVHAIVKDIGWRGGDVFWQQVRQATGLGRVAPRGSRQHIRDLLAANQIVAFLVDQHLPAHRAMVCQFFGQLAATTPAPVRFAMETGAPIMPIFIHRSDGWGRHVVQVEPEFVLETPFGSQEANVRHNTERLNRLVERWVRTYPDQWLWLHKRWKVQDRPEGWEIPASLQHLVGSGR